jgi:hypothetical protein
VAVEGARGVLAVAGEALAAPGGVVGGAPVDHDAAREQGREAGEG